MITYYRTLGRTDRIFFWLSLAIILLGIALRLAYWFHNRDLIIDEANIARNLSERGYSGLAQRLSYEQYAPVLFLWIQDTFTIFFGFSEQALRAYPLLCGIGALFVFMMVLKEFISIRAVWFPLLYLATAHFFARYSTEVKQYMPDVLITLLLIWLALKTDILSAKAGRVFLRWLLAGSIAVWASMASVFILSGIGFYYLLVSARAKQVSRFLPFLAAATICAMQFGAYYLAVLKQDAHSDYLQNFHKPYFLIFSGQLEHWKHNYYVITDVIKNATGIWKFGIVLNLSLMVIGTLQLLRRQPVKSMLVLGPLALTIIAAFMKEFSLIPRVVLFTMPLYILLIGAGLDAMFSLRVKVLSLVAAVACLYAVYIHHDLRRLSDPFYSEQITWGMELMQKSRVMHKKLHVSHGSYPAYLYYTTIHPGRQRWASLFDAKWENWDANWWAISMLEEGKWGALFSTVPDWEAHKYLEDMQHDSELLERMENPDYKVFAYVLRRYPKN
jgi:4-amino-4-deoxy-L-arabinose transferase-like glycosyltransferase